MSVNNATMSKKVTSIIPGVATRKAVMKSADGRFKMNLPFAPVAATYAAIGRTWTPIARPGRLPILAPGPPTLSTLTFTLTLADPDPQVSQEKLISTLWDFANTGVAILLSYGPSEGGQWRVTSLSIEAVQRNLQNQISWANATIELTEASDLVLAAGPLTGGSRNPKAKPGAKSPGGRDTGRSSNGTHHAVPGGTRSPRRYIVQAGDTAHSIAIREYGDVGMWRRVLSYNHITAKQLTVGRILSIPW